MFPFIHNASCMNGNMYKWKRDYITYPIKKTIK